MAVLGSSFKSKRDSLTDVLPLATPFSILVDPSSICNFSCKFCPCANNNKIHWGDKTTNIMSYELFRKIVDDICGFPQRLKSLRLYKEGEPLLNKRLPDMISYAKNKGIADEINFTTNGSLLTHDLSLALIDAGLDRINISIEALDSDGYFKISGVKIDFDKFIENLHFLFEHKSNCHIFMKITNLGLVNRSEEDFYRIFECLCDEIAVEYIKPVWPDFSLDDAIPKTDSIDTYGRKQTEKKEPQICPYLFYSLCVNSDGSVSPCCVDWDHKLILGNVKNDNLLSIWNGEILNKMRINHLQFKRNFYTSCRNCGQLKYCTHDYIDDAANELLMKYM